MITTWIFAVFLPHILQFASGFMFSRYTNQNPSRTQLTYNDFKPIQHFAPVRQHVPAIGVPDPIYHNGRWIRHTVIVKRNCPPFSPCQRCPNPMPRPCPVPPPLPTPPPYPLSTTTPSPLPASTPQPPLPPPAPPLPQPICRCWKASCTCSFNHPPVRRYAPRSTSCNPLIQQCPSSSPTYRVFYFGRQRY